MIEVRGKTSEGQWLFSHGIWYGDKSDVDLHNGIFWEKVDPETVGQFTGLRDRKGNKIFEGDVVRFGDDIYQIVFADACFWISDPHEHYSMELHTTIGMGPDDILGQCGVEVIGNIHDDPNLLKANDG